MIPRASSGAIVIDALLRSTCRHILDASSRENRRPMGDTHLTSTSPASAQLHMPTERELREVVLGAYQAEAKSLVDSWGILEGKAQASASITGVFIAGALAFAHDLSTQRGNVFNTLFVIAILLLVVSAICAVWALSIRSIVAPPSGGDVEELVTDLLRVSTAGDTDERYVNYLQDLARRWQRSLTSYRTANQTKAEWIARAHGLLICAAFVVAALAIRTILRH